MNSAVDTLIFDLDDSECIQIMRDFVGANPELWDEDVGGVVSI
jgi:hypothetical protein